MGSIPSKILKGPLYSSFNMSITRLAEEVEYWGCSMGNWCRNDKWHLSVTLIAMNPWLLLGETTAKPQIKYILEVPFLLLKTVTHLYIVSIWRQWDTLPNRRLTATVSQKLILIQVDAPFFRGWVPSRAREGPRNINRPTQVLPDSPLPPPPGVSLGHGKKESLVWQITQLERQAALSTFSQDA